MGFPFVSCRGRRAPGWGHANRPGHPLPSAHAPNAPRPPRPRPPLLGYPNSVRVLVSGATGWLGRRLVTRLLRAGLEVRALLEPSGSAEVPDEVERAVADLRDRPALMAA